MGAVVIHLAVCGAALVRPDHVTDEDHAKAAAAALIEDLTEEQIKMATRRRSVASTLMVDPSARTTIIGRLQRAALPVLIVCNFVWHMGE
uniref:Uncharacterized protein n=1 Tax=Romanomermis culicivorax TaxID=13658 RepID=A0A915L1T7_ROMCU